MPINSKYLLQHWSDEFELPDGSYLISDIQDYIEYILKNIMKMLIIPH